MSVRSFWKGHRQPLILSLCVLILFALAACKRGEVKRALPDATFVTIHKVPIEAIEDLQGRAAAHTVVDVRPQVNGQLDGQLFIDGSQVVVGQPLFQIDKVPYQAAFDSAIAILQNAQTNLDLADAKAKRARDLLKQSAISKQDYDIAEADYKRAITIVAQQKANLATAQYNLDKTTIRAPLTGYIGRAFATRGSLVTAYQPTPLASIQARDPIYIDIPISSEMYSKLKQMNLMEIARVGHHAANRVTLRFGDGTIYPQEGRLELNNVAFDKDTGKVLLRAAFPNPKMLLLPGMGVHVMFNRGKAEDRLLVPQDAIRSNHMGNATVLVIDKNNFARERVITASRMDINNWVIGDELHQGDRVVVGASSSLKPDSRVHPVPKQ